MGISVKSKKNVSPLNYAKRAAHKRHLAQGENQLKKEVVKAQHKYGKGSLDIKTGEFTPID